MKDKIISIIKGYECDAYFGANLNHLKEEDYDDVAKDIIKKLLSKHNVNVPDVWEQIEQLVCSCNPRYAIGVDDNGLVYCLECKKNIK